MSCKVLRVGVFFDGTGNNLTNDQAGKKESNIAKLYKYYATLLPEGGNGDHCPFFIGNKVTECKIITTAIYIEGLGTAANKRGDMTGAGMGSGGAKRIDLAIKQLKEIRIHFPQEEYKLYIDVFGFSRGAALARDFINSMHDKHFEISFTFKFVGLFDTVASFGKAGNEKNYKPISPENGSEGWSFLYEFFGLTPSASKYEPYNFNLSPSSAEKIVHLVALDEYRQYFPLTDTEGAGTTYHLVGAHSDVGGGYSPLETENIFEYTKHKDRKEAKYSLENPNNGIKIGEEWHTSHIQAKEISNVYDRNKDSYIYCYSKREVSNDLQNIGLILMYNLAISAGVPFLPLVLDETQTNESQETRLKQCAYQAYDPALQRVSANSACMSNLLGQHSEWSQELKNYCIEVMENPLGLASYLGSYTDTLRFDDYPNQKAFEKHCEEAVVKHTRGHVHLSILAKYAHNSACTSSNCALNPPPIGFKHRSLNDVVELESNSAFYAGTTFKPTLPVRIVFSNKPELAIVAK